MSTYKVLLQCPYSLGRYLTSLRGAYRHTLSFLQDDISLEDLRPTFINPNSRVSVTGGEPDFDRVATVGTFDVAFEIAEDSRDSFVMAERLADGYASTLINVCRQHRIAPLLYNYGFLPNQGINPKLVGLIPIQLMRDDTVAYQGSMETVTFREGPHVTLMGKMLDVPLTRRSPQYSKNVLTFDAGSMDMLRVPEGAIIGRALTEACYHLTKGRRDGLTDFYWPARYITDMSVSCDRDLRTRRHVLAIEVRHAPLPGAFAPVQIEMYVDREYLSQLITCMRPDDPLAVVAGSGGATIEGTLSNAFVDGFADVILIGSELTHKEGVRNIKPLRLETIITSTQAKRRVRIKRKRF